MLFVSVNGGVAWIPSAAPYLRWVALAASADGSKLAASAGGGIYTYAAPGLPTLGIGIAGANNILYWPWPSTDFVLQRITDLNDTNWTTVTNLPAVVNQILISPVRSPEYYRLKLP
jgi:hypothetical protein